jgi:putative nucleotidyltransferase with HDIG domain
MRDNIEKCIFSQKTDKLINHSKIVCEIALEICNELNVQGEERQLIKVASLLHDVKKFTRKKHSIEGATYIAKNIDKIFKFNNNEKNIIELIVRYHNSENDYLLTCNEKQIQFIEIVRAADKIAKLYKHKSNDKKVYKDVVEKIDKLNNKEIKSISLRKLEDITINEKKKTKEYFNNRECILKKYNLWHLFCKR